VVYGRDGLPLFLPLDADIEELRREVLPPVKRVQAPVLAESAEAVV
jgi:hypothetical protein